jgi:hypothetical protein
MTVSWGNGTKTDTKTWSMSAAYTLDSGFRAEMMKILYGDGRSKPKSHQILIRHMTAVCPCVLEEQGQKYRKADPKCSVCHGEGFTYAESPYAAWRSIVSSNSGSQVGSLTETTPGISTITGFNYFFDYNCPILERDKIIEVSLGLDGSLPNDLGEVNHLEKFKVIQRIIYRADNGRAEFIRCICEREEWR